jgi:hypothetical protein
MESLYLFIAIIAFFVIALSLSNFLQRRKGNTTERETPAPPIDLSNNNGGCCGAHEICEKDSLIATVVEPVEYFDDEELDKYRNRDSDRYNEKEVNEFRDIFYSVLDEEKPRWIRSLQRREIALPDQLKDEVLMIVNDLRAHKMHA